MTIRTVPDTSRSATAAVTTDTQPQPSPWPGPYPPSPPNAARYSFDDRRTAIADIDACTDLDEAAHFVLGALMEEVRANARGGARPEDTRRVLALSDVYEERVRAALGYGTVPARVAALAGDVR